MDSNVESKITKYGLRLTVLLVLMLPYSYQHWLDTGYDVTRIVAWLWEYFYAINPDPRFEYDPIHPHTHYPHILCSNPLYSHLLSLKGLS